MLGFFPQRFLDILQTRVFSIETVFTLSGSKNTVSDEHLLFFIGVRRYADVAQAGRHGYQAAITLRAVEVGGRTLLQDLL